jgi:dTDP-4-amino-4,6-dideoxygalactose transaminase
VLPVHVAGLSGDPSAVRHAAGNGMIIEDACHALGGIEPDGAMVGGCRHSDMACFSFHPVKPITTAEGGAVTTNDPELVRLLRMLRNHGLERDPARFASPAQALDNDAVNPWYYEQQRPGFNYQLTRLDAFLSRRRELALYYDEALARLKTLRPLQSAADARRRSGHHLYLIDIDFVAIGKSRRAVMAELRTRGVGTQVHYIPLYRQPFHRKPELRPEAFPNSEAYYRGCLSIPLHPGLTDEDAQHVARSLHEVCGC